MQDIILAGYHTCLDEDGEEKVEEEEKEGQEQEKENEEADFVYLL